MSSPTIELAGESALLMRWTDTPGPSLTRQLVAIADAIEADFPAGRVAAVPAYQTLLVHFDPARVSRSELSLALVKHKNTAWCADIDREPVILPVCYEPEFAPDIAWLAARAGCSIDEVVSRHCQRTYHAYANGFAPGFCYLGEVDASIAAPRMDTPRRQVAPGSVGIADRQTAVYPEASPGGWRLIGRCPLQLFDLSKQPPNRLTVGDRVRFEPIDRATFIAMGGQP